MADGDTIRTAEELIRAKCGQHGGGSLCRWCLDDQVGKWTATCPYISPQPVGVALARLRRTLPHVGQEVEGE